MYFTEKKKLGQDCEYSSIFWKSEICTTKDAAREKQSAVGRGISRRSLRPNGKKTFQILKKNVRQRPEAVRALTNEAVPALKGQRAGRGEKPLSSSSQDPLSPVQKPLTLSRGMVGSVEREAGR